MCIYMAVSSVLLFPKHFVSGDGAQRNLKNENVHETAKNWSTGGFNMLKSKLPI